ncbi:MAG: amino acid permease [Chitinophagales bacterium]|nr:amino acid permease [Chitinophagales bacterium]MDW8428532.1 amino acid permease [Chitinophagales bacterium]
MTIRPTLKLFDVTMIVVSMVIGIGIFRNPAIVAQQAGNAFNFFLVWVVGGLVAFCGALTFAEIGSRLPVAGGFYRIFSLCYSPALAFMLIWTYILLTAGAVAAVTFTGVQYLAPVILPVQLQQPASEKIMFVGVIGVLFTINYLGIKAGSMTQNLLSLVKIVLVLVLISALVLASPESHMPTNLSYTSADPKTWFLAVGTALVGVYFSYGGYQNTANLGADAHCPHRTIPRGILLAMLIVVALYLLINFTYVYVLGFEQLKQAPLVAEALARRMMGDAGSAFAGIAIFLSVLGYVNAALLFVPRVFYAMAQEGVLPMRFHHVHQRKQVQEFTLAFFCILVVAMFLLLQNYDNLLNYVMFNDTLALAFAAYSIFILRKRNVGDDQEGYRIRWYPWIPSVFIAMQVGVTISIVISDPTNSLVGAALLVLGYPIYLLLRKLMTPG